MRKTIIILLLLLTITSCVDKQSKARLRVQERIDSIDNECPVDLGIINIKSMSINKDTIIVRYSVDDNFYPIQTMGEIYQKNKENINTTTYLSFFDIFKDTVNLKSDMVLMNASIKYIVSGKNSFEKYEMFISNDEINKLANRNISDAERNLLRIKNKLAGEAYRCPYKMEKGMWMDDVYLDGKYITFKINMDEDLYSMEALQSMPEELKCAIQEEVKKLPALMAYSELLAIDKCHLGLQYIYVGSESGKSVNVKLEPTEMPNLSELKANVNEEYGSEILK